MHGDMQLIACSVRTACGETSGSDKLQYTHKGLNSWVFITPTGRGGLRAHYAPVRWGTRVRFRHNVFFSEILVLQVGGALGWYWTSPISTHATTPYLCYYDSYMAHLFIFAITTAKVFQTTGLFWDALCANITTTSALTSTMDVSLFQLYHEDLLT